MTSAFLASTSLTLAAVDRTFLGAVPEPGRKVCSPEAVLRGSRSPGAQPRTVEVRKRLSGELAMLGLQGIGARELETLILWVRCT